jgi:hypothetical protein
MVRIQTLLFVTLFPIPNLSPSTTSWCTDNNPLPCSHSSRVFASKIDSAFFIHILIFFWLVPVELSIRFLGIRDFYFPNPDVKATCSILSTRKAIRMVDTAFTQDGDLNWNSKPRIL